MRDERSGKEGRGMFRLLVVGTKRKAEKMVLKRVCGGAERVVGGV